MIMQQHSVVGWFHIMVWFQRAAAAVAANS
jgi:hypothetical protein